VTRPIAFAAFAQGFINRAIDAVGTLNASNGYYCRRFAVGRQSRFNFLEPGKDFNAKFMRRAWGVWFLRLFIVTGSYGAYRYAANNASRHRLSQR
jgi:hypothetical protein